MLYLLKRPFYSRRRRGRKMTERKYASLALHASDATAAQVAREVFVCGNLPRGKVQDSLKIELGDKNRWDWNFGIMVDKFLHGMHSAFYLTLPCSDARYYVTSNGETW